MGFLTRCKRPFLFAFLLQFCNMFFSFFLKTFLILFEKQQQAQEGLPYLEFPVPEGVVARRYDPATGCLVPSGGAVGYYTEDNLPPEQPALP